jgi:hypothetical protein
MPTLVDRGVSRGHCGRSHAVVNLSFLDRSRYFSIKFYYKVKEDEVGETCGMNGGEEERV